MSDAQFEDLGRFVSRPEQHFDLPLLAGGLADGPADPEIRARAVRLSLLLGGSRPDRQRYCFAWSGAAVMTGTRDDGMGKNQILAPSQNLNALAKSRFPRLQT